MIVDVHSHLFAENHVGPPFATDAARAHSGPVDLTVSWDHYAATSPATTRTIVVGGKARLSGLWVDDEAVATYVAEHGDRLIGYLSLDPLYAYAQENGLPLLVHTGTTFVSAAPLKWALPIHLDEVASRFPGLRMVLAHLGHPFEGECIAVIRKHEHVYADVSALHYRPFQLWHSLRLVQDYGVWRKLLFGSDFPFTTVDASIAGLRAVAAVPGIPGLDPLDRDEVEKLIHRDALPLLGLR